MGIRQAINENPRITAGVTIGILVALMVAVVFMRGTRRLLSDDGAI